jgi:hypothetical protein
VYDTQGPRDHGVDVLLNYQDDGPHRLGLQIKSYKEIEDWARKRDNEFITRIKMQHGSAIHNVGVKDYFLLICTDEIEHKDQIRLICSEMMQFQPLKIVLPRQTLAFFEMSDVEIQAYVTRLLCSGDSVLKAAFKEVKAMPKDRAYLILTLICEAFEGRTKIAQKDLSELYHEWEEPNPCSDHKVDRLGELVEELEGNGLSLVEGGFSIDIGSLPTALCAMYFDQKQRRGGDMKLALTSLLGVTPERHSGRRLWR